MRCALAAVAALAIFAAACGGVEHEANLAKAVDRTEETGSSRIEARTEEGADNGLADRCEGVADYEARRLEIACTYRGDPVMTMRQVDGFVYFKYLDQTDRWLRDENDEDDALSEFSPEGIFSLLREASSQTVRVGEEDVRDVATVRYRLTVDRERAELGVGPGATEVDVWIDDDGLLRRVAAEEDGEAFTIDFFDFGIPVDLQAPPADQVSDLEDVLRETPCTSGAEHPVRVGRAREGLRAHGFDVEAEEECPGDIAGELTNLSDDVDDLDALMRDEGYVTCQVRIPHDNAITGTFQLGPPTRADSDGPRAETRTLRNLECTIFYDGPKGEAHLERLDRAFDELKRELGP